MSDDTCFCPSTNSGISEEGESSHQSQEVIYYHMLYQGIIGLVRNHISLIIYVFNKKNKGQTFKFVLSHNLNNRFNRFPSWVLHIHLRTHLRPWTPCSEQAPASITMKIRPNP